MHFIQYSQNIHYFTIFQKRSYTFKMPLIKAFTPFTHSVWILKTSQSYRKKEYYYIELNDWHLGFKKIRYWIVYIDIGLFIIVFSCQISEICMLVSAKHWSLFQWRLSLCVTSQSTNCSSRPPSCHNDWCKQPLLFSHWSQPYKAKQHSLVGFEKKATFKNSLGSWFGYFPHL